MDSFVNGYGMNPSALINSSALSVKTNHSLSSSSMPSNMSHFQNPPSPTALVFGSGSPQYKEFRPSSLIQVPGDLSLMPTTKSLGRHHPSVVERNVYVASLPQHYDYNQLEQLFASIGPIEQRTLKFEENRCKGYGFVLFQRKEDALEAVRRMHGSIVDGTRIQVRLARQEATMKAVLPPQQAHPCSSALNVATLSISTPPASSSVLGLSNSLSSPPVTSSVGVSFTEGHAMPLSTSSVGSGCPATVGFSTSGSGVVLGPGLYNASTSAQLYTPAPFYNSTPANQRSSNTSVNVGIPSPVRSPLLLPPTTPSNAASQTQRPAPTATGNVYYVYDMGSGGPPAYGFNPAPSNAPPRPPTTLFARGGPASPFVGSTPSALGVLQPPVHNPSNPVPPRASNRPPFHLPADVYKL